jgi:hypothetical protein
MSKEFDYVITLRRPDAVLFNFISQLMLFLSLLAFVYTAIYAPKPFGYYFVIISILLVGTWLYARFFSRSEYVSYKIPLVIAALGWMYEAGVYKLVAVLLGVAFLLEKQVKFAEEIGFDNDGLTFNSFPSKFYKWSDLANVVLKDGLITVDFKNNKILQKELDSDVSGNLEKEFNEFCSRKLKEQHA